MRISYMKAKYLKHAGKLVDIKVSFAHDFKLIFMRNFVFSSFESALHFIREDSHNLVA